MRRNQKDCVKRWSISQELYIPIAIAVRTSNYFDGKSSSMFLIIWRCLLLLHSSRINKQLYFNENNEKLFTVKVT